MQYNLLFVYMVYIYNSQTPRPDGVSYSHSLILQSTADGAKSLVGFRLWEFGLQDMNNAVD